MNRYLISYQKSDGRLFIEQVSANSRTQACRKLLKMSQRSAQNTYKMFSCKNLINKDGSVHFPQDLFDQDMKDLAKDIKKLYYPLKFAVIKD